MNSVIHLPLVPTIISQVAADYPDRVAFSSAAGEITYADVDRRANQVARYLVSRAIGSDNTVVLSR